MWLYSMTLFHNKILIINNCFVVAVISLPRGVQLFVTPWTVTHQVSLSMGFPRQEHWSGLPFPSPGDLPDPMIEPKSFVSSGIFFTTRPPRKSTDYTELKAIKLIQEKLSALPLLLKSRT